MKTKENLFSPKRTKVATELPDTPADDGPDGAADKNYMKFKKMWPELYTDN